jgi:uncharacterized protein (DUF1330 family)
MIALTQFVYVDAGKEKAFEEFEAIVLPLLPRHGGELLLRLRPNTATFIAGSWEVPYEVHVVSFETEEGLVSYSNDEARQRFLELKNESVRSSVLIKGTIE